MIHDLIQLDRPLIGLDLETTGLFPQVDRIVQIGVVKVYPDGTIKEWETLVDPGIPIQAAASNVHGITNAHVENAPVFEHISKKLFDGFRDCDFCGYNLKSFDIPFITAEFDRCGLVFRPGRIIDTFKIFTKFNPRNLSAAVKFYLDEELHDAHTALADARASVRILRAQILRHSEIPRTMDGLCNVIKPDANYVDPDGKFIWGPNNEVICNFGKEKSRRLKDLEPNYLTWVMRANFSSEVKEIVRNALAGKYPTRT